jgi:hypothetical protein
MNLDFEKLNSYFGPMALTDNSVQFELPSIDSLAKAHHTIYEKRMAKEILDVHYSSLRTEIIYEFPFISYGNMDIIHRSNFNCMLTGISNLRQLENRWKVTEGLLELYNEMNENGNAHMDDYFKIMYEFQEIEEEFNNAMDKIESIGLFIQEKLIDILPNVEKYLRERGE